MPLILVVIGTFLAQMGIVAIESHYLYGILLCALGGGMNGVAVALAEDN